MLLREITLDWHDSVCLTAELSGSKYPLPHHQDLSAVRSNDLFDRDNYVIALVAQCFSPLTQLLKL